MTCGECRLRACDVDGCCRRSYLYVPGLPERWLWFSVNPDDLVCGEYAPKDKS